MDWLSEAFSAFLRGFAMIFLTSLVLWMAGLLFLLFRELFSSINFVLKAYLQRVWRMLILCFEYTPYGFVLVGPILLFITKEYLVYSFLTIDAVILTILFFMLRKRLKPNSSSSDGRWSR
ncbi:hypothetical protein [Risungbinella massiliensis]|uniref:hypothetical protein n=1 Tax=Risungbinella massiliensis TaxID=1329796 RepID=UPI0005CBE29D|nr:hypothetical protein [Risungbinella massiliensis]